MIYTKNQFLKPYISVSKSVKILVLVKFLSNFLSYAAELSASWQHQYVFLGNHDYMIQNLE
jgi:hypothetical protein